VRASAGSATVFGRNPWTDAAVIHARVGFVPGDVSVWPSLSGGEIMDVALAVAVAVAALALLGMRRRDLVP